MKKTAILATKPPVEQRRGKNIGGIPGYQDNPAMDKGYEPDQEIVQREYDGMVRGITSTGKADLYEINFPHKNDLNVIQKLQGLQGEISDVLKNPNGKDIVNESGEFTQHDFVFVRDSFISNQKNKIIISNFSREERKIEEQIMKEILETLTQKNNIDRKIITAAEGLYFEGGNFRYIPEDGILFAGKQNRNNAAGINFIKEEFGITTDKLLMIDGISFHVDTYFSVVTGDDNKLIAGIICPKLVHNMDEIRKFFKKNGKMLLEVEDKYGMGEGGNGKGNFATNTLQLGEYLIGCDSFDEITEMRLKEMGIKRIISPMTQYNKSGGAVHCSTNQL